MNEGKSQRRKMSVSLPEELAKRVEQMARRVEMTRNRLLTIIIAESIESMEQMDSGALLKFVLQKKGLRDKDQEDIRFMIVNL